MRIQHRTTRYLKYEHHENLGTADEPRINTTIQHSSLGIGETALDHYNKLVAQHKRAGYEPRYTIGIWWVEETISITRSWTSEEVLKAKT
jgi:hypothetical protein